MRIDTCPRCGTRRPDELQWCRKCGLDFQKAERGELPSNMSPTAPTAGRPAPPVMAPSQPLAQWQQPAQPPPTPIRVDLRQVNDRRNMAQWTRDALDLRCGTTAGGCLGMLAGFVAGPMLGSVLGSPVAALLLAVIGVPVGLFAGMRLALSLMAR